MHELTNWLNPADRRQHSHQFKSTFPFCNGDYRTGNAARVSFECVLTVIETEEAKKPVGKLDAIAAQDLWPRSPRSCSTDESLGVIFLLYSLECFTTVTVKAFPFVVFTQARFRVFRIALMSPNPFWIASSVWGRLNKVPFPSRIDGYFPFKRPRSTGFKC